MSTDELLGVVRRQVDQTIRPRIQAHGGDISVDSVSASGVVHVTFRAACRGCGLRSVTTEAIRQSVLTIPGISGVEHTTRVSEFARERLEAFATGGTMPWSPAMELPHPTVGPRAPVDP